jgi:uncharacterized membrane protein YhhN
MVGTCVLATALVIAEYYRTPERASVAVWILKPLASAGFLAAALASHALDHVFGQWIFTALSMCFLGDVLLIPRTKMTFLLGLMAFLGGHVAFGIAFGQKSLSGSWTAVGAGGMLIVGICVGRWLWPHVRRKMKAPLVGYIAAITVMVSLAAGVWGDSRNHTLMAAAVLFALSDILIARDRFLKREFINRAVALPVYYMSQLLFAVAAGI